MVHYVARTLNFDFIYFDLLFCLIWMIVLLRKKYFRELLFGLFGACVVFFVDDVLWLHIKETRHIDGAIQPDLFLLYFSFTYGMIEFSYVIVMFKEKRLKHRLYWTLFLYIGWLASAFMSQYIPLDDRIIEVGRDMASSRLIQIIMVISGYLILLLLKFSWKPMKHLDWKRFTYLFFVGIFVHFGMEFTLFVSGIRPGINFLDVLVFNSLLEFNTGVPILYMAWVFFKRKDLALKSDISIPSEEEKALLSTSDISNK